VLVSCTVIAIIAPENNLPVIFVPARRKLFLTGKPEPDYPQVEPGV
jgi:hypothetical protein